MKKQTKVLLAAALFTLGASFSSMAALKNGEWKNNEEGWQYVDKDGEYVESQWCMSYGKEYWINEDGVLGASEWVEENDYKYYAQSDGSMTKNAWKYLYAPDDEDEEGDQNWYWFDQKGRMVKSKAKLELGDAYYYFDSEGKMLTGWVNKAILETADENTGIDNVVFCNEDGKLVTGWFNMYPWTMTEDDAYDEDYKDYYADSNGKLYNTKKKIDGLYYFFDATTGQMMDGWIWKLSDGTYTSSNATTTEIGTTSTEFYWTDEVGYAKTDRWLKLDTPKKGDDASYWYYFDKAGKLFVPTATDSNVDTMKVENGNVVVKTANVDAKSKKYNGEYYYINQKGEMLNGLAMINGELNYLVDGVRQTGKFTLEDNNLDEFKFCFAEKTVSAEGYKQYKAVTGNKDNYLYDNGKLITAVDSYAKVTVGGREYIVDVDGKIQSSTSKTYDLDNGGTFKLNTSTQKFNSTKGVAKNSIIAK